MRLFTRAGYRPKRIETNKATAFYTSWPFPLWGFAPASSVCAG